MSCLFNSYDPYFKQPFGALRAGQTVRLTLCIPEELGYVDPHLVIQKEGKYDVPVYYRMKFDGQTPKQNHFSVDVTLNDVGLYFYYFDLYTDFRRIVRGPDNCGVVSWQDGEKWQITVYEADFRTPETFKGKVFYQIFPDRFCEGVENKPMPFADRIYQADKHAEPFWQPNETGGHLNEDYFGGDLEGIRIKLPYLREMGVDYLYLNPIFEAHSNHRYNTADYLNVDPLLGTNEDFETLCAEAKRYGIGIVLDGVFSHTGSYGVYFALFGFAAIFLFSSYNMLPTAHNNNNAIMKRAEKAEAAMAEYVKHYPHGAFPVKSWYAHPIVLKQMMDAVEEGRAVTVPEALDAVKNRLKELNADVQVDQDEYDEVVVIKAMFLNHDYE